jgi:hypothetical protein
MSVVSTVSGIRIEIASRLNEEESDNTDQYTTWINLCLRDIENSFQEASFLQTSADRTLSSGTRVYTNLPTDFYKMNMITYPAGDTTLSYLTPEEFDILQPSATEGGNPNIYTIRGFGSTGRIEFYPVPTGGITLHYDYLKSMNVVSVASAVPEIPAKYLELPVLYGEMRGLRRRGRFNESQVVAAEYERLKERMRQDLMSQTSQNQRIRSIREYQTSNNVYDDPIKNIFHN